MRRVETYVSMDGKTFPTEKVCKSHEKDLAREYLDMLREIQDNCDKVGNCKDCAFWGENEECVITAGIFKKIDEVVPPDEWEF